MNDLQHEPPIENTLLEDRTLQADLDAGLDPAIENLLFNSLTSEGNAQLIENLRKALSKALKERQNYKKKWENKKEIYEKLFQEDQLKYLEMRTSRGHAWSEQTISNGLKLYLACGTKGYEEIRRQNLPYPSIRTLQHRIRNLKFSAGIIEHVFNLLQFKVVNFHEKEKHAVLIFDEMAIKPGIQFDTSTSRTIGRPTMKNSAGNYDQIATHALVFMLAGVTTRCKQTVAYELTGNSFCPQEMLQTVTAIIHKAHEVGLKVMTVVSDMGGQNRAFWRQLNIIAGRHSHITNYIPHPVDSKDNLFIMPDAVHVFKNVAAALTNGRKFNLNQTIVDDLKLPSTVISIKPIKQVFDLDKGDVLKLCPRLKANVIYPSHFEKMNVALSVALLNHDVGAAILYHIACNNISPEHRTTAWFINIMYKWFKFMTARFGKYGLSLHNQSEYNEAIAFLNSFINIVRNITVDDSIWKPFQTGLLLVTQTAIDLLNIYLHTEMIDYLLLGRFTQDALENLFSTARSRQPVPDAREFKVTLRLLCLSQFECNVQHGNYEKSDHEHLISYCDVINEASLLQNDANGSLDVSTLEHNYSTTVVQNTNCTLTEILSNTAQASLHYLLGSILYKVKQKHRVCGECFDKLITNDLNSLNLFTTLKEYKKKLLIFPNQLLFDYIYQCELDYRRNEYQIVENQAFRQTFVDNLLENSNLLLNNIQSCHNVMENVIKQYIKCRIYFSIKEKKVQNKTDSQSNRSVAMKQCLK